MAVPSVDHLYNPLLQALRKLGGSAAISELENATIPTLNLSENDLNQPHGQRTTEVAYRLAWARTNLKIYGLLDNSQRGVWVLTPQGTKTDLVDSHEVRRFLLEKRKQRQPKRQRKSPSREVAELDPTEGTTELNWREHLQSTLLTLPPDTFERLCQRMLRESGFVQVEVTGRSGDGGIDGIGRVTIGGLLSFPILFQCKRYQGSVGPSTIRDFRGAMIGRTDRGLVITTGTFTREAKLEATRDGAPPIDLVDGEDLLNKLKELRLGVQVQMVEAISIDPDWFQGI
ncbi:MAG: restriction endonuclease [Chloroflexota bacterium]|nr:restriction endonuclease [Chloroflexota bacterium]